MTTRSPLRRVRLAQDTLCWPARPRLEVLEDRTAPAIIFWDGGPAGTGTVWNDPANWVGDVLPGQADDAEIGSAFSSRTIGLSSNVTVRSVASAASLSIDRFSFSISAASSVSTTFRLAGCGTLTGAGDLTINSGGTLDWSCGIMAGAGRTVIAPGATAVVSGIFQKGLDRTLSNAGVVNYTGSNLFFGYSAAVPGMINNLATGTFNVVSGNIEANAGTGHAVNNAGTVNRSGPGGTFFSGIIFNNTGTVNVQGGTFGPGSGGSHTGDFVLAAGTTLQLWGTHGFAAGADVTGSGAVSVVFGTSTFTGSQTLNTLTVNGTSTVAFNSVSSADTVSLNGTLTGSADFTIRTALTWGEATMAGAGRTVIAERATATLAGRFQRLGRVLENAGRINMGDSSLIFGPGEGSAGVLNNQTTGTINVTGDGDFGVNFSSPGHAVNNAGTFNRSGPGDTAFDRTFNRLPFTNTGTVDVREGRLEVQTGSSRGAITVRAGATFHVHAGVYTVDGTLRAEVDSTVETDWGVLRLNTDTSIPHLRMIGYGGLGGSGTVTITGRLLWTHGGMSDAGRTVIAQGVTADLIEGDDKTVARILDNAGTINYHHRTFRIDLLFGGSGDGIINNLSTGVFNSIGDGDFLQIGSGSHAFNNAGTFNRSGAGDTTFFNDIAFTNTGTVNVLEGTLRLRTLANFDAATSTLAGGAYWVAGTFQFAGANIVTNAASITLDGPGSVITDTKGRNALANFAANAADASFAILNGREVATAGSFTNAGLVFVGDGSTFGVSGDFTQTTGTTTLFGGTLTAGTVNVEGGVLDGSGVIAGDVRNAGQLIVGGPGAVGWLYVFGNYVQADTGRLDVELAGLTPEIEHDYLYIDGTAVLDGELNVALLEGYRPNVEDYFAFLWSNGGISGDFATFNGLDLGDGSALWPFTDGFGYYLGAYLV